MSRQKDSTSVYALSYGDGKIRTYRPDAIDYRLLNPEIAKDRKHVIEHLSASEDVIMVPVDLAIDLFGWLKSDFDLD